MTSGSISQTTMNGSDTVMSYNSWRKDNEAKYREMANDGRLEEMSAFEESSKNDLTGLIENVVDDIISDERMSPVHFACVFGQYLYETYGVVPADIELMSCYFIQSHLQTIVKVSEMCSKAIAETISNTNNEESTDGSD